MWRILCKNVVKAEKQCGYSPPSHGHSGICRKIHSFVTQGLSATYSWHTGPLTPSQTTSRIRLNLKKKTKSKEDSLFSPELFFQGRSASWGSLQVSWANTWTSSPERAATLHRCLWSGGGAGTSLLIKPSGLPAVKPQPQAPARLYAKATCGPPLPEWVCHGQIRQTVRPF